MKISLEKMCRLLNASQGTIIAAKKRLGYPHGYCTTDNDIKAIKDEIKKRSMNGRKINKIKNGYYEAALEILERDGYITNKNLMRIFKATHSVEVESYFEGRENPIYTERITINGKRVLVFKLFNILKEEWRKENLQSGKYNNNYNGNPSGIFATRS